MEKKIEDRILSLESEIIARLHSICDHQDEIDAILTLMGLLRTLELSQAREVPYREGYTDRQTGKPDRFTKDNIRGIVDHEQ